MDITSIYAKQPGHFTRLSGCDAWNQLPMERT